MGIYIFDIDGTIADAEHRMHYIKGERSKDKNWPAFYRECINDEPIQPTAELCRILHDEHYIVLFTGRDSKYRELTMAWLEEHYIPYDDLFMRPEGDNRQDAIVKQELFEQSGILPEQVEGVFEDRSRVVKMWRDLGLICYQVCEGDY